MFMDILSGISVAYHAVFSWFWDIISNESFGSYCLATVIGMIAFTILFRFILLPVFNHTGFINMYGIRYGSSDAASIIKSRSNKVKENYDKNTYERIGWKKQF